MTHYELLQVSRDASADEIRRAYRRLALKHHPDRGGSHEMMVALNLAFATLSDPVLRAAYDNRPPPTPAPTVDDSNERRARAAAWAQAYPAYDGLSEYLDAFVNAVAADILNTSYHTLRGPRGAPLVAGDSASAIIAGIVGAALVGFFVLPLLPVAVPAVAGLLLTLGFSGGTIAHSLAKMGLGGKPSATSESGHHYRATDRGHTGRPSDFPRSAPSTPPSNPQGAVAPSPLWPAARKGIGIALLSTAVLGGMGVAAVGGCFLLACWLIVIAVLGAASSTDRAPREPLNARVVAMSRDAVYTVARVEQGDLACYITLTGEDNSSTSLPGDFSLCYGGERLVGKEVYVETEVRKVFAESCAGDLACDERDLATAIVAIRPLP